MVPRAVCLVSVDVLFGFGPLLPMTSSRGEQAESMLAGTVMPVDSELGRARDELSMPNASIEFRIEGIVVTLVLCSGRNDVKMTPIQKTMLKLKRLGGYLIL
jgi:hypothetical protein